TVALPAAAAVARRRSAASDAAPLTIESLLLLPDVGTGPVAAWLVTLQGLSDLRGTNSDEREPLLVVRAASSCFGADRVTAWESVVHRAVEGGGSAPLRVSITPYCVHHTGRSSGRDQVLELTGRHPFLTIEQLASLIGVSTEAAGRLRSALVRC